MVKSLGEPGNEKKLENAIRVMEWFSTQEGMMTLSGNNKSLIYPLRSFSNEFTQAKYRDLWNENLNSIKAPMLYTGYEDVLSVTAEYIAEAIQGNCNLNGLAEFIDTTHKDYLESGSGDGIAGSFESTLSHEETVQLFANILYEKGDSDIALVSDGERRGDAPNTQGAYLRFFKGKFLMDYATCQVPGSPYNDPAVQMTLTGEAIKELLEHGKMVTKKISKDAAPNGEEETVMVSSNYPYFFAGMTVDFKDGNIVSMKLNNSEEIELNKTYTVTFAANDFTDLILESGNPENLGYSCYDALLEYLDVNSPVSAPVVLRHVPEE